MKDYLGFGHVRIVLHTYINGRLAVKLVTADEYQEPVARLTVNLPDETLGEDEIFVPTYKLPDGTEQWMRDNDVIVGKARHDIASGYVRIPCFKLSPSMIAMVNDRKRGD